MRITNLLISTILMFSFILLSGCIDTPVRYNDVPEKDVNVNDIWIGFVIEWKTAYVDTYVLIPTLSMEDGTILSPMYDMIGEGDHEYENPGASDNISIVETEHGMALRYNISGSGVYQHGFKNRSSISVPYIIGDANILFNTRDDMNIKDRYFEGGPGFSIWEEKGGKVKTWTYVGDEANWIRLYLERRGSMNYSHSWGTFDCYKDITYEPEGSGWFNIQLERRTSFPMD